MIDEEVLRITFPLFEKFFDEVKRNLKECNYDGITCLLQLYGSQEIMISDFTEIKKYLKKGTFNHVCIETTNPKRKFIISFLESGRIMLGKAGSSLAYYFETLPAEYSKPGWKFENPHYEYEITPCDRTESFSKIIKEYINL